jgi:hypothetical protein
MKTKQTTKKIPEAQASGITPAVETPAVETPAVETPAVETPAVETPAVETPAVETPVVDIFTHKGKNYGLSDRMPEKLKFYGHLYTKNELITNEEVMTALIVSDSPFIKKI